ncbi:MAG: T9SS type A sorting domain-containing protein [Bacteroidia bacterium]
MIKSHLGILLFGLSGFINFQVWSQTCNPDSLIRRDIRAIDTDAKIKWELGKHITFYNPTCKSLNTLLVHLVGTSDDPQSTTLFTALAANNGYHVINLKYPNQNGSAQGVCKNSTDTNCFINFRKETIEGLDYSPDISVDSNNCIYNRLYKLLKYLEFNHPNENWSQYVNNSNFYWDKIIVSGHSQGGGHAAVIAIENKVKRVLMFASPNDYSTHFSSYATWIKATHITPDSNYYGFTNYFDNTIGDFSNQVNTWTALGMNKFGDTTCIDHKVYPFLNSRQLYTKIDLPGVLGLANHSVMIVDEYTVDSSNKLLYEDVWKYMLGIIPNSNSNKPISLKTQKIQIYPNPCKDQFIIQSSNLIYSISIFNSIGKLVYNKEFRNQTTEVNINIDGNETGLYFIELIDVKGSKYFEKLFHH